MGAHPDDETIAAPLLGRLCVEEGLTCTFLVITRGEAGSCRLAGGCHPDLASVRIAEMERSARLFGAQLLQWTLPDGGARAGWAAARGSDATLVADIASFIGAYAPDLVLTFDPRHGSTCHPDHAAAGELVLAATRQLATPPTVFLLETVVRGSTSPFSITFSPATSVAAGTFGFDANSIVKSRRSTAWQFTVWAAQAHASQFEPGAVRGLSKLPAQQRVVYVAPAALALDSDSQATCN